MSGPPNFVCEEWSQVSLAPELGLVIRAVDRLCGALSAHGALDAAVAEVRLAVTEALTNSVRHGQAGPDERSVVLRWVWQGEWLEVIVSEPGEFAPDAAWKELPADPLAESGRGGFLMAQCFEELEHSNARGRHRLRLRKRLGLTTVSPATAAMLETTLVEMTQDLSASYETLSALFKLAEALATTEDLPAFVEHALRLRSLIGSDTMHLRFCEPGGPLVLLGASADGCEFPSQLDPAGDSVEAEVFRTGFERTTDARTVFEAEDPLRKLGGAAFVCPVYFQSRQLGICVLGLRDPAAYFTAAQLSLTRSTARFLGIAHANADLQAQRRAQLRAQRELEIAAQIQQSLVPASFPVRPDWRLHGRCENAQEAGGDFFDVLEVPGGVLLVIADVMGKGVPAALLAVVLRTAVRAHAGLAATPGQLLNRVSAQIAPDLDRLGMFITVQVVFLGADSPRIVYSSAGHCPMLALSAGGETSRLLDDGGLPLGVSQTEIYTERAEFLSPGERIVLLTDGLIEAPDQHGRELGADSLAQAVRDLAGMTIERTCAELLAFVHRRDAGRRPTDDRTLLIAERLP